MKVRDMVGSVRWGVTFSFRVAHIMHGRFAECGMVIWSLPPREQITDMPVCKRCLKATEKYA